VFPCLPASPFTSRALRAAIPAKRAAFASAQSTRPSARSFRCNPRAAFICSNLRECSRVFIVPAPCKFIEPQRHELCEMRLFSLGNVFRSKGKESRNQGRTNVLFSLVRACNVDCGWVLSEASNRKSPCLQVYASPQAFSFPQEPHWPRTRNRRRSIRSFDERIISVGPQLGPCYLFAATLAITSRTSPVAPFKTCTVILVRCVTLHLVVSIELIESIGVSCD